MNLKKNLNRIFFERTIPNDNQNEHLYHLKLEIEEWRTRYNYVLSEKSTLMKQKSELEAEVFVLFFNFF